LNNVRNIFPFVILKNYIKAVLNLTSHVNDAFSVLLENEIEASSFLAKAKLGNLF
jgi:hypothetical protein